jgi:hypothetical protein
MNLIIRRWSLSEYFSGLSFRGKVMPFERWVDLSRVYWTVDGAKFSVSAMSLRFWPNSRDLSILPLRCVDSSQLGALLTLISLNGLLDIVWWVSQGRGRKNAWGKS